MKKIFYVMALFISACATVSCGSSANSGEAADSTLVDSVAVVDTLDSAAVVGDTVAVDTVIAE